MNSEVIAMIDQLHARLEDVRSVAGAPNFELIGFAKRLDKLDDELYLLQVDMEKFIASQISETGVVVPAPTPAPQEAPAAATDKEAAEPAAEDDVSGNESEAENADSPDSGKAEEQPAEEKKEEGILSEAAKENISAAAKTIGEMLRDSKDVIGEVTDVVKDVKDTFDIKGNLRK